MTLGEREVFQGAEGHINLPVFSVTDSTGNLSHGLRYRRHTCGQSVRVKLVEIGVQVAVGGLAFDDSSADWAAVVAGGEFFEGDMFLGEDFVEFPVSLPRGSYAAGFVRCQRPRYLGPAFQGTLRRTGAARRLGSRRARIAGRGSGAPVRLVPVGAMRFARVRWG